MRYAYDKVLAKIVTAEEGRKNIRPGDIAGRYRCPNPICKATVTVKGRDWPEPYFAHLHNRAAKNCEDYHPGSGESDYSNSDITGHFDEREQLKRPGLQLYVDSSSLDWKLTYYLPRHELNSSHIFIRVEPEGEPKKISTRILSERPLRFSVIPSGEPIGYAGNAPHDPSFDSDYFSPRSFRLHSLGLTAFHSPGLSYHRAVGAKLFWGTSYFVIWNDEATLQIPDRLVVKILRPQWHWCCALIALPLTPVELVQRFLEQVTNLDLHAKHADIRVLYPHLSVSSQAGELRVPASPTIILSVSRSAAVPLKDGILVESKEALTSCDVDGSAETFIMLQPQYTDNVYYFVRYADEPATLIYMDGAVDEPDSTTLFLKVERLDGTTEEAPFFSLRAHNLLAAARRGARKHAQLIADGSVSGMISARTAGAWSRFRVVHSQESHGLAPLVGLTLNELLRTRSAELHLDFGAYGYQVVLLLRSRRASALFDTSLIVRAHWLLSMATCFDSRVQDALNRARLGDSATLAALLRDLVVPAHLEIHLATLRSRLQHE